MIQDLLLLAVTMLLGFAVGRVIRIMTAHKGKRKSRRKK